MLNIRLLTLSPNLLLEHHAKIKNAKRYLRHLNHHHADFLFLANKGLLRQPLKLSQKMRFILTVLKKWSLHKVHKIANNEKDQ